MKMLDPEDEAWTPLPRKRSLTLESHTNPFSGSSLGRSLEYRRQSLSVQSISPSDYSGRTSPSARSSCSLDLHDTLDSTLAGNLCYYRQTRRSCFIEYGFVNHALEMMIVRRFGEDVWEEIRNQSEAKVASPFIVRMLYDDNMTYNIVEAASEVTGVSQNELWELFGEMFFEFCEESGYDKIIKVLGKTLRDFLQNLDALHDHLSTIYPGMRAPSFRVTERTDGALVLHYTSERSGLEHVVIGMVRTVAKRLHNKHVKVEILPSPLPMDHVQLLITELPDQDGEDGDVSRPAEPLNPVDDFEPLSYEPRISPATFCKAFPFHIMMDSDLRVIQSGQTVSRIIKELDEPQYTFKDIFQVERPQIDLTFENIIAYTNTVFVVRAKDRIRLSPRRSVGNAQAAFTPTSPCKLNVPVFLGEDGDSTHRKRMCLKGQMCYIPETDKILFLCSPSVGCLEDLNERGLYLSDIPIHDSTRDLVLLSEQFRAEYELTQKLEVMNDKLQQTYRELEIEKQLTDKLVYSILPPSVANKLRMGRPVEAVKYEHVSILFSGICDFNTFCTHVPPMHVVNLLNEMYTKFDALADPRIYNVYKVETVGDKYMLASGLPERSSLHAKNIALVALDMIDIARDIVVADGEFPVRITIGIHSGEVVAGVVGQKLPRYAVFGSTVCLASRMESHGLPDCINISEATYQYLQNSDCEDEQFLFEDRGDINVKGMKTPVTCYLLSRNLKKLPKVQLLLESNLAIGSRSPLLPSPGGLSPSDEIFRGGRRHHSSPRPSHGRLQVPLLSGITPPVVNLPDPTTQTLLDTAQNIPDSTTQTLLGAAHSLSNLSQSKHAAKPTNL